MHMNRTLVVLLIIVENWWVITPLFIFFLFLDYFNDLISDCEATIANWEEQKRTNDDKHSWSKRMENLNAKWESCRPGIFEAVVSDASIEQLKLCLQCRSNKAMIRCVDCKQCQYLCISCDESVHAISYWHNREVIYHGYLKPIPPKTSLSSCGKLATVSKMFSYF